jgi:hypothetical protein
MSIGRFAARTLLWLPPCFAAWWLVAPWQSAAAGAIAQGAVKLLTRGLLETVERTGSTLAFVTTVQTNVGQQVGALVPEVNALVFGYGLPVFIALMAASRAKTTKLAAGAMVLVLLQGVGVMLGFLAQLVGAGPGPAAVAGLGGWASELVVVAYQLFSLVVPGAAPILLWAAFQPELLSRLVAPSPCAALRA